METSADPGTARPLRRDAERNRRRILDSAATVFAERGLAASFDDIAAHAEVGVGTVYRRFPDKDELIDALFDDQLDGVVAIAEAALAIEDPWDGLVHFLRAIQERQVQNRGLKELLLGTRIDQPSGCAVVGRERVDPLVRQLVERAHADGSLRSDVAATDIPMIQVMIGASVDYAQDVDPDVWRRMLTLVIDGLRAGPVERTPMPARAWPRAS